MYNFCFVLFLSFLILDTTDHWSFVDTKKKVEEIFPEQNSSIWVLFYKEIGGHKIGIRFPSDPTYGWEENGSFFARSEKNRELFEFTCLKNGSDSFPSSSGGKFVEHLIQIEGYICRLRVYFQEENSPYSEKFFSSFRVGK